MRVTAALAVSAVVLVMALVLLTTSATGVCASCHAMRPFADRLSASKHSKVACYGCHLPAGIWSWPEFKTRELTSMYPRATLGMKVSGPGQRTSRAVCLDCHSGVMIAPTDIKGIRIVHSACAIDVNCDECHSDAAHGKATRWIRQPDMDVCIRCHLERQATTRCDACHVSKSTARRLATGSWKMTHGPNWRRTHGLGDIRLCATCHPPGKCAGCHGTQLPHAADFGGTHGDDARKKQADCSTCHDRQRFCTPCHGIEMPHPAGFLKVHPKSAKSETDPKCIRCHFADDCVACHVKHTHPGKTLGTIGGHDIEVPR